MSKKTKNPVKHCTAFKLSDKQSIKICLECLEKLWKQSKDAEQVPQLVIGVRRNDNELFVITGELTIEAQKKV